MADLASPGLSHAARGALLAGAAGLVFSFYGLLFRLLEQASVWHIILYRGAGIIVLVLLAIYLVNGPRLWHAMSRGWRASLIASVPLFGAQIFINLAFAETTVASVLFVTALAPFGTALLARIFLGEGIRRRSAVGMAIALAGVALVAGSGIASGRLFGFLLAVMSLVSIVVYNLVLRANRDTEMLPAVVYSTALTAGMAFLVLMAKGSGLALPLRDIAIIQLMGAGSLGLGLVFFTLATRLRPVAELSLFAQLEIVLTPIWVWLGVGEAPTPAALVGGAIIVTALAIALAPSRPRVL